MTTPSKRQLMPSLPDRDGHQTVRLPSGDKAVMTRVPRDQGTPGCPNFRDTVYVHTARGTTRYALRDIRRIQTALEPWTPHPATETEAEALRKAEEGKILWAEALSVIGVDGSRDRSDADGRREAKDRREAEVVSYE